MRSLTIMKLLAPLCVWQYLSAQIDISIVPSAPTTRDSVVVILDGSSGNNVARVDFQRGRSGSAFNAQLSVYSGLLPVVMPWRVKDTLGMLPAGMYGYSVTVSYFASNFQGGYTLISRQSFSRAITVSGATQVEVLRPNGGFSLGQNYPNPFNASTLIPFEISEPTVAELSIMNLTGQIMLSRSLSFSQPGTYQFLWDASQVASGAYYYRLRIGLWFQTHRALLIK
jgi:hypothetical protein